MEDLVQQAALASSCLADQADKANWFFDGADDIQRFLVDFYLPGRKDADELDGLPFRRIRHFSLVLFAKVGFRFFKFLGELLFSGC